MTENSQTSEHSPLPAWLSAARRKGLLSRLPDHLVAAVVKGGQRAGYPLGAIVPEWEAVTWLVGETYAANGRVHEGPKLNLERSISFLVTCRT